jgi:hypothetical protein
VLQKLIVVDDFYDDPQEVRKRALQLEYPDHGGRATYAGRLPDGRCPPSIRLAPTALRRDLADDR